MKELESNPSNAVFLGARTFLCPEVITYLEADINYTIAHFKSGERKVLSKTILKVHSCIEPHGHFVRISKKHVVNMDFVEGNSIDGLILEDGTKLNFSRRRRKKFLNEHMIG